MTPAARAQAAIGILDSILSGAAAEQALTGWARRSRFAGSKDRAAVRDHVFDILRTRRTCAARGGAMTGRGLMLGALRLADVDPDTVFCSAPYAPAPLSEAERDGGRAPVDGAESLDLPEWLWPLWQDRLGDRAEDAAIALKKRAPVHLRVNLLKSDPDQARESLLQDGVTVQAHPAARTALLVLEGARRIRASRAYMSGLVELQDAASQAVVEALPLRDGMRVLDFCAGGGGKTLALAAQARLELFAHDAAPRRMRDLPERARRAGADVTILETSELARTGPFDLVLCDAPCSGSGSWRRAPEGKWSLTPEKLAGLCETQRAILKQAANLVSPGGTLAYATCSVLTDENAGQIDLFLEGTPGWRKVSDVSWMVSDGTDGFYMAHLTRVFTGT
ncbi:RsmB/NOP family class I SAM-dependent RNA methyltransferase [Sedimentitalea sp. JM2-8]|uniref:RsmB/NOP family class I SAM-dependent RNA methyltransferase n=1 Tax=Sedimentitalea xiamensis TaxID=3050037 RepID=A0ABT7FL24_9RHOB|nr:RsmB/NOP family class I SAM-dependent RNA methyltransferase [Sedimentitalea xiamensis]MDK3075763.1 RsmB/NOP family class I SAM-dependent RNA methyltransferase [Sedimentitalea xiamensis]